MLQRDPRNHPDTAKQCISLGAAIVLVSFLLMYVSPTWPAAFSVLGLSAMGAAMSFFICRSRP